MTTLLKLRGYQETAIFKIRHAWAAGVRRPAVVLPTGAGKTVVFAHLAAIMAELGVITLILAHRDELIEQAAAKVRAVAPGLRVGIWKGDRREWRGRQVIVASVQSLARAERREELARAGIRLIIIDEAHHAVANTYMEVLRSLGGFAEGGLETGAAVLGVSATLGRSDKVRLDQVWQEVAYRRDIIEMIREGYLVNAKGIRVKIDGLDLRSVKRTRGDYQDAALAEAMHEALAPKAIARAYVEHAADRQGVVFGPTVELAYELAETFSAEGIVAEGIDGAMPVKRRREILAAYARGDIQVVTNCMVLTEGWDAPWCSAVVVARPTSSAPLYIQMAGRGLRPHPGKQDCLVIDVVGVTGKHRLASVVDLAGADRVEKLPDDLLEYDLLELFDEPAESGPRPKVIGKDGPLVSEIVDLFTSSRRAWLRTARGVWFLSAGDKLIFLAPGAEVGLYLVVRCETRGGKGEVLYRDLDLDMAMSRGEQEAAGEHGVLTQRSATWRKSTVLGTAQVNKAAQLGIVVAEGMTKGELSDAISHALASQRLDAMPGLATVTERSYW